MTTFHTSGPSGRADHTMRFLAVLLTTLLVVGMAAPAKSAPGVDAQTARLDCSNAMSPQSVRDNQYVLLLFFENDPEGRATAEKALNAKWTTSGTVTAGCMKDPSPAIHSAAGLIKIQGSCPTDCTQPKVRSMTDYTAGDPMSRLNPDDGWGIFFADASAKAEAADADSETHFRAWQITARDACHAGYILQALNLSSKSSPGYLGHIMIGHLPKRAHASGDSVVCKKWDPPAAVRE